MNFNVPGVGVPQEAPSRGMDLSLLLDSRNSDNVDSNQQQPKKSREHRGTSLVHRNNKRKYLEDLVLMLEKASRTKYETAL